MVVFAGTNAERRRAGGRRPQSRDVGECAAKYKQPRGRGHTHWGAEERAILAVNELVAVGGDVPPHGGRKHALVQSVQGDARRHRLCRTLPHGPASETNIVFL